MKRKQNLILVVFLLVLVGIYIFTGLSRIRIDGIRGDIGCLIFKTDTEYSEGYTHSGFNQIEIGMSEEEVLSILGEPIHQWSPYRNSEFAEKKHYTGYTYSESPTSACYRLRHVYFDHGTVAEIIGYFYVD